MRTLCPLTLCLVLAACDSGSPSEATPLGPPCSPEAIHDGRALYDQVYRADALTETPRGKPIVPKKVVGAKLYLTPTKSASAPYLLHAARCYAKSKSAQPTSGLDPLRASWPIKTRMSQAGGSWVLSIEGADSAAAQEILGQSRALAARNDAERAR